MNVFSGTRTLIMAKEASNGLAFLAIIEIIETVNINIQKLNSTTIEHQVHIINMRINYYIQLNNYK